jgi:hypothetical protein
MPRRIVNVLPYASASASVKSLRAACLNNHQTFLKLSPNSPKLRKLLDGHPFNQPNLFINWGNTSLNLPTTFRANVQVLNPHQQTIQDCVNKRWFFLRAQRTREELLRFMPKIATNLADAESLLSQPLHTYSEAVLARTRPILLQRDIIDGSNGDGITPLYLGDRPAPDGKLWVVYYPKKTEYRVHLSSRFGIVSLQKKLLPREHLMQGTNSQFLVRNYSAGWRYSREAAWEVPSPVLAAAAAFRQSSFMQPLFHIDVPAVLDFCALDIIYNERDDAAYILEANTAPGIGPSLAQDYTKLFDRYFELLEQN